MAAAAISTVPGGPTLAVAEVDDGIVLVGAAVGAGMVGVFLHGWAANAPMSISGGYRFAALALSFEMPLALVLIAAALPAESLALGDTVESQAGLWNVVRQPLGLPLYLRSEEHTSELQSLMRISYAVFCLKKKKHQNN